MKKTFFTLLFALAALWSASAQVVYEDFEGAGADLAWNGLNGIYNGQVNNPDPTGANTSLKVGSYTNVATFDFNFALYTFPAVLDISEFNQFKMKIWSPIAPTKALLKLEGPGGPAVEKFVDITEANKWVEYTFDLSAGASYTNLKTILISFNPFVLGDNQTYYFDDIVAYKAERCYADFEGPGLVFQGLDGTLTAPVDNPDTNFVNNSPHVAQYVKSGTTGYSLLLAESPTPFDLSVYNQFKVKIYATAPTQVLAKLEGPGVASIEKLKNIAVTNDWQEYTFDFGEQAANTGLTKFILFFDPGVDASTDTYYFDDVCAVPNPCPGVAKDPEILDDFECNRNATYAGDWSALSVVKNPFPTGDNNSAKVGKWVDPAGPGTEYSNFNIDYQNPIDLTTRNIFSLKLWAPKAGTLLLKIEGGTSAKEVAIQVTELNKWVEYTADFSAEAGEGHKKLVVFINAGQNGAAGDVYYVDDIKLAAPKASVIEDFQGVDLKLGWQPLDQNETLHGVFTAPTDNPQPSGINNSTKVGCYAKGSSPFSTLQAFSLTNFDLKTFPQFNLDVLSPNGGGSVTMQLNSPTQGNKEATAEVKDPGKWETLSFDFSDFSAITDFGELRLIFKPGTANPGQSWCIDNLRQSKTTVDPCDGAVPVPNIIDDYECQRNYTQIYYGASDLKVVNNPHLTAENGSLKVGEYTDPAGAGTEYAGIGIEFPAPPDLSVYNHLSILVWSPTANVPFLFKLEGGSGAGVEVFDTLTEANKWVKMDIDFSKAIGTTHNKLVIFTNVASAVGGGTYFFDNIRWARAGYNGCVVDFQTVPTSLPFTYFANGALDGLPMELADNPKPSGINTSNKVGKFVRVGDALKFAGVRTNPDLESPIDWKGVKTVKAKVLMDHIGNFAVKVENSLTGAPVKEIAVPNTKINEWEELTFDFSSVPDNGEYIRLTLFFDLNIDPTGTDVTSYFDDVVIGTGSCTTSGTFSPTVIALGISPNPVSDQLFVQNVDGLARVELFNIYGQRMGAVSTLSDSRTDVNVSMFPAGVYTLTGYDRNGVLMGNAKFVKQ